MLNEAWQGRGGAGGFQTRRSSRWLGCAALTCLLLVAPAPLFAQQDCEEAVAAKLRIDQGHPWRPPFGLERVGKPVTVSVEMTSDDRLLREYSLVGYRNGQETERHVLNTRRSFRTRPADGAKYGGTLLEDFKSYPDEIALYAQCRYQGQPAELARVAVEFPAIEAQAAARPDKLINPIDLGTIFVPHDWLILAAGQSTVVDVAAISYAREIPDARVKAWFESAAQKPVEAALKIQDRVRSTAELRIGPLATASLNDALHVAIVDGAGAELWSKKIQTMLVPNPPALPKFGAKELKLRYDPPISINTSGGGKLSFLDYDQAWDPKLKDLVVSLPNGSRFVFWRGSSYIPFWMGLHNTGMCYEWAETTPPPDGFEDSIEPLMDKEIRYGRAEIVESTASRVHVRWTYQSTDFQYKVWGDQAVEDFYFYPDGFGTRVLSLKRKPTTEYELSEFIVLTPQSAYPLDVLPEEMVEMLYLDGEKRTIKFPGHAITDPRRVIPDELFETRRKMPVVYRVRVHKDEQAAAIYFHASDDHYPLAPFGPFYDRGYLVTPAYWGSHWPLARGKSTGMSIDDRIDYSPAHNSLLTWGVTNRPTPVTSGLISTLDTLGNSKEMRVERWVWLIGMNDASDTELLDWAHSFSRPPSLELKGATLDYESYVPDRRAFRVHVENKTVAITIRPVFRSVNPVFEFLEAPGDLAEIKLDGQTLPASRYAWDGKTLWLEASLQKPQQLEVRFR